MTYAVVPHNPLWKQAFGVEAAALQAALGVNAAKLHHIGSTAIPNILAKPIIDILIEVSSLPQVDARASRMHALGYEVMGAFGIPGRRFFRKFDGMGTRTHHVHIFQQGSAHVPRHLAFRDLLITHPQKAQGYSQLKADITRDGDISWEDYLDGKDPFIKETEGQALAWFSFSRIAAARLK